MSAIESMRAERAALDDLHKAKRAEMNEERLRADGWWYRKTATGWKKSRKDGAAPGTRITDPARMLGDHLAKVPRHLRVHFEEARKDANRRESRNVAQRAQRRAAVAGDEWTSPYFKSAAAEAIFRLTELDGEQRVKHLGLGIAHYRDPAKAKAWHDQLAKLVHPDRSTHPKAAAAFAKLREMYKNMTDAAPGARSRARKKPPPPPPWSGYDSPAAARRDVAHYTATLKEYRAEAAGMRVKLVEEPHDAATADKLGFNERMQATFQRRLDRAEAWLKTNAGATPESFREFTSLLRDISTRTRLKRPEILRRLVVDLGAAGHQNRPARPTLAQFLRTYGHLGEHTLVEHAREHLRRHYPTH